ncbi:SET and MYND domain-containing 5 [Labeo rohita]|uniref:SET and MYND domain-containing 5 n=1 Tax=Labeo rohita TaxID=84645 RepID=A0A498NT34_LABRO|nr:SET and MYND domain-containing 5 [Labeo rohita]
MAAPVDDMFSRCVDPAKASNNVEVRFIDNVKGKGLFAKRPFKKGDTIFIEQPLVSSQFLWNALYKYRAEENARRLSGLPALSLPHPELCKVRPDRHKACPQCQGQLALLRNLFTTALYEDRLSQWFTPDGFRSLFSLVGTNGQGIGTSSLSQWVHACDALELPSQQREQLDAFIDQLYKDIDKGNHSCVPNAEASFPDNNFLLHLSALSDISPGEEICISYLDCCQRDRSRHSRHKILRENYLFICSCQKCMSQMDDADMTSEDEDEVEGEGETEGDDMEDEMTDV